MDLLELGAYLLLAAVARKVANLVPPETHDAALVELVPHRGPLAGGVEPVAHPLDARVAQGVAAGGDVLAALVALPVVGAHEVDDVLDEQVVVRVDRAQVLVEHGVTLGDEVGS